MGCYSQPEAAHRAHIQTHTRTSLEANPRAPREPGTFFARVWKCNTHTHTSRACTHTHIQQVNAPGVRYVLYVPGIPEHARGGGGGGGRTNAWMSVHTRRLTYWARVLAGLCRGD